MMKNVMPVFLLFVCATSFARVNQPRLLDIDMSAQCRDKLEREVDNLNCDELPSLVLNKKDEKGEIWKVRFHFGFSRTQYYGTDLHISSSVINVVVRDVEMHERTSAHHYNPANWDGVSSAFKWIDEPTNTFTVSLEKGKNNFYLTVFHPKYLKSVLYKEIQVDGQTQYEFQSIHESDDFSQQIPAGYSMLYLGNTHKNLVPQIGYGRQISIFNSPRYGKLTYIPKADIGLNIGQARSVRIVPGVAWDDYIDQTKIQGYNASIGHRLEYQRGRVSAFIDHKAIYSKMKHGFYDETVEYNLLSTPLTFGLGVDIFNRKKR